MHGVVVAVAVFFSSAFACAMCLWSNFRIKLGDANAKFEFVNFLMTAPS
jgi:hypothetical protein